MTEPHTIIDGRFELEEQLGRGGMGEVWRARQVPLGRPVALKLLREEYSLLGHLRRRFAREARAAARLSHESIASIYDFGVEPGGRMFIAMEYVQGPRLIDAVRAGLTVRQIVELGRALLDALAHAHARGVVHRDLKPENVLMAGMELPERLGQPKIVDFGIATLRDERGDARETGQDQVVGTPLYMSPEQASGERNLSPRTDLYSLGMILYELIAGTHPFEGEDNLEVMSAQVHRPLPPLMGREGLVVPEELVDVVAEALAKRPAERWDSAAKMRDALDGVRALVMRDARYEALPRTPYYLSRHIDGDDVVGLDAPTRPERAQTTVPEGDARATVAERPSKRLGERARPNLATPRATPFVGRGAERADLLDASAEVVRSGRGRIVLLEGEAGVGKTRLAMWLKETQEERGAFRGHIGVFSRGAGSGAIGLQEVFESLFRTRGKTREALERRVEQKLLDWGSQAPDEDIQALAEFLRPAPHAVSADEDQDAAATQEIGRLFGALVRMLEAASRAQPRQIILDDVHWASVEIIDFLDFLATEMRQRPMPLMVVVTMRREELGQRPRLARRLEELSRYAADTVTPKVLGRLPEHEGRQLVGALLPARPELMDVLWQRSAGNPLYLVLLVRYLSHEGHLSPDRDGMWYAPNLEDVRAAVPPSLADLFRVRVRQLEERYGASGRLKRLMARAAVLGRRFSYDALTLMYEVEGTSYVEQGVDEDFDALLAEGIITEVVGRGEDLYTFNHGLMRDVLLNEEIGPAKRRTLHRLAAEALVRLYGEDNTAHASEIASHWHAGRKWSEAIEWAWRAAQAARRGWRLREALQSYTLCASMMEQRLGVEEGTELGPKVIADAARFDAVGIDRSRYLRAIVYAGDIEEGSGEFAEAEELYRRVVKMCGPPSLSMDVEVLVPLCQAWLGLGHVAWQRGDFTAAHWAFDRVYSVLSEGGVAPDIANSALRGLARVAWHRGEYDEATELAGRAHQRAIAMGDEEARAESLWILGEIARMLAMRQRAQGYFEQSLEMYEGAKIPTGIARNLLSQAQMARYHKDFERAKELYERALDEYETLRDRRGQGLCLNGLGEIARFNGSLDKARARYTRALEIFRDIGAQYDMAITYTNLGLIELRRDDLEAAERYLQAALSLVVEKDYPYLIAGIGYNLALVKTMRGRRQEAAEILRPVWALNDRVPISDLDFAEPLEELGSLRQQEGATDEALALLERARDIYAELNLPEEARRVAAQIEEVQDEDEGD